MGVATAPSCITLSNWLYPLGRVRPGTNIAALQTEAISGFAQLALHATGLHRARRLGPHSHAACDYRARRRGNSDNAAGDRAGSEDADDSFLGGAADCLRQHCQPGACAQHHAARRHCGSHGAGCGTERVIRQTLTESVLLSCIGGLAGLAVAYAGSRTILALGVSRRAEPAHRCQPFA